MAHFDFVVYDKCFIPQFTVEFDGPTHGDSKQRERDRKKDSLCQRFGLPILRINYEYINRKYRDLDLLGWFIESWFLNKGFEEAQQRGDIPNDEPFDAGLCIQIPGHTGSFPLWLSAEPLEGFRKLHKEAKCFDEVPAMLVGHDDGGTIHGMAYIRLNDQLGVMVATRMRYQHFPISGEDAIAEIVPFLLYQKLIDTLEGADASMSIESIKQQAVGFKKLVHVTCQIKPSWDYWEE
jgi:hypothetical protein